MTEEILYRRDKVLVRRLVLQSGEATHWHRDACQRVSVIVSGTALDIEYRDGNMPHHVTVAPGQVDWDMPAARIHRALNVGPVLYEEVTVFFLDSPDAIPQPEAEPSV